MMERWKPFLRGLWASNCLSQQLSQTSLLFSFLPKLLKSLCFFVSSAGLLLSLSKHNEQPSYEQQGKCVQSLQIDFCWGAFSSLTFWVLSRDCRWLTHISVTQPCWLSVAMIWYLYKHTQPINSVGELSFLKDSNLWSYCSPLRSLQYLSDILKFFEAPVSRFGLNIWVQIKKCSRRKWKIPFPDGRVLVLGEKYSNIAVVGLLYCCIFHYYCFFDNAVAVLILHKTSCIVTVIKYMQ